MAVEISASTGALYPGLSPDLACAAAAADGFTGVEFWTIAPAELALVERSVRAHELVVTSLNAGTGDGADDFGLLAVPDAVDQWRLEFCEGLDIARQLGARALNLLAGGRVAAATRAEQLACLDANLAWCLDRLDADDPVLLIEPLNAADRRSPVVRTVEDAVGALHRLGLPSSLGILFDAYHLHQEEPDLLDAFARAQPHVRHVQVADHPGRGEPGTGSVPLAPFLRQVASSGYSGWIGCEFHPSTPAAVAAARAQLAGLVTGPVGAAS
jgi:hydroxypyruvate isomerase